MQATPARRSRITRSQTLALACLLAFLHLFIGEIDVARNTPLVSPFSPAKHGRLALIEPHEEDTFHAFPILEVAYAPIVPRDADPAPTGLRAWTVEEVEQLIRHHAAVVRIADVDLVVRIASCESGLRWDAKNPHSTAAGVFQYLARVWANTEAGRMGLSVFDADANIRMAVSHIAAHGTAAWNASRSCWDA